MAEVSTQRLSDGAGRAAAGFGAGAHGGDGLRLAVGGGIDIGVVGKHVAGRIGARGGVEHAAGFDGGGGIIDRDRIVVAAVDGDGQRGPVGQTAFVGDGVGEAFRYALAADSQRLDVDIGLVDDVGEAAVAVQRE